MPLKLFPPREGRSPNWTIRGTYLKIRINQSTGTDRKALAARIKSEIEQAIERGDHSRPARKAELTFLTAAVRYMESGRRRRFIARLIEHFGETPVSEIDQEAVDAAALVICPSTTPATRNATVYTPVAAILHFAGVKRSFSRPKGAKGMIRMDYMTVDDAQALIAEAAKSDRQFGALLMFLLYTGCRLGEALALTWERVEMDSRTAYINVTKNGDPRAMLMRPDLADLLAAFRPESGTGRVFKFRQGGWLKQKLLRARLAVCGLPMPARGKRPPPHRLSYVKFHTFRHTWATWMRRYAGADVQGLVATGNWRDARSAARYTHVLPREEWSRVDQLPDIKVV